MKEYTIYTDLHIGGQWEINPFIKKSDGKEIKFSKNTIFLGDNFDLRNAFKTNAWMQISHLTPDESKELYIEIISSIQKK